MDRKETQGITPNMIRWPLAWVQMAQPTSCPGLEELGSKGHIFLGLNLLLKNLQVGPWTLSPNKWRHHPVAWSHTALQNNDKLGPLFTQTWKAPWLTHWCLDCRGSCHEASHPVRSSDPANAIDGAHEHFRLQEGLPNLTGEAHLINKTES